MNSNITFLSCSVLSLAVILILRACLPACSSNTRAYEDIKTTNEVYAEKCQKQAGIRIYKKIRNVDAIFLEKIRPVQSGSAWTDRLYPGAAFAHEVGGEEYIQSFLGYEHSNLSFGPVTEAIRGYITNDYQPGNASSLPGYSFVQAIENGVLYKYTLETIPIPESKIGMNRVVLRKVEAEKRVRYAVTYEDHVIPIERFLGIASSTVKVIDTQTNELLGEYTRYSRASSFSQIGSQNLYPWLSAKLCGQVKNGDGSKTTRQFVDQVLIPSGR